MLPYYRKYLFNRNGRIEQFFEDYELGAERVTVGRTITETDIVMHAMHSGDFYPHHLMQSLLKRVLWSTNSTI